MLAPLLSCCKVLFSLWHSVFAVGLFSIANHAHILASNNNIEVIENSNDIVDTENILN